MNPDDRRWLDAAARLAAPWRGTTAENPTVGAIVVSSDGRMVGRGVTARGGRPHAEPQALAMAGAAARGATLYVTLEPCAHWGRTPPCVDAVIAAGLGRVVVGQVDPDPRTAGQSLRKLADAGIAVTVLPDHEPSRRLHEGHASRVSRGRPFVTLKLATSADGMIGRRDQGNVAITGEEARRWTHRLRAVSDAVMVGSGTARLDRPRLTVRLAGLEDRAPLRVVLEGRNALPPDVIRSMNAAGQSILIVEFSASEGRADDARRLIVAAGADGRPDPGAALAALAVGGVATLLVEGGAALSDALLAAGLVDRFHWLQSDTELGPQGVPASASGPLPETLAAAGLVAVAERALGCDRVRSFERP